ncbi:UDP-N-acetylmuramoyl-tripeptide--D-alanyl-D-alanine ligase [Balneatrix alpica]|uniref:UDP-N-acetylmuramoyl-tripeptide--D-alanyl-D- alanine ligase n=1 Tax=Balneatrix alpica TaxID=75684 RepID=UPI002739AEF0|nr:UDP-N-acetylmuramoyl-tripeptide--D-alanyl-D-alanine ligase [Balneatrix alpica]
MIGSWSLATIADALQLPQPTQQAKVQRICTDSRSLQAGDVFVALEGERFDGHQFIDQAEQAGAVAVVVHKAVQSSLPVFQVINTLTALGQLGAYNRSLFSGKVAAVTGSAGKTTVKEMLAAIMREEGFTLATRGNLNNEIGAPLTLLELNEQHQAAVIELGASGIGEIARTVAMTRPQVSILTNAGRAHIEGFGSLAGVVQAKGEIIDGLPAAGVAILNADDPHFGNWYQRAGQRRVLSFGLAEAADCRATDLHMDADGHWHFTLQLDGQARGIKLQLLGRHNVVNALAATAAAYAQGVSLDAIQAGLEGVEAVKGRLHAQRSSTGLRVIDDSYNANPEAMCAAIDLLMSLPGPHVLVVGDMAELGEETVRGHQLVGEYAGQQGVEWLFACGPQNKAAVAAYRGPGQAWHFDNKEQLIAALKTRVNPDMVVLCKGSRSAQMEQVVKVLLEQEN